MNDNSRFVDKGDLTILDNETGLIWAKEDSWPIAQDWLAFQEALQFVDEMNKIDYLGFQHKHEVFSNINVLIIRFYMKIA